MSRLERMSGRFGQDAASEIAQLRRQMEQLLNDRVSPALGSMVSSAEHAAKSASDEVRYQANRVADVVHERPVMALGIAVAAGFLLASFLRR